MWFIYLIWTKFKFIPGKCYSYHFIISVLSIFHRFNAWNWLIIVFSMEFNPRIDTLTLRWLCFAISDRIDDWKWDFESSAGVSSLCSSWSHGHLLFSWVGTLPSHHSRSPHFIYKVKIVSELVGDGTWVPIVLLDEVWLLVKMRTLIPIRMQIYVKLCWLILISSVG